MTHSTEATTKPDHEETTAKLDQEETTTKSSHEETKSNRDQEETNSTAGQEETKTNPDQETFGPKPNLNECFTFDVGYSKPPRDSWYTPGTSGNPGGRPKGSKNKPKKLTDKNFNEILRSVLYKDVSLKGGKTVSVARAVTQNLADQALGGNLRAIQLVITSLRAVDAADAAQQEADYNYAVAYKAHWENISPTFNELDRRRAVPHPDHIILDHRNKRAMFKGPRNEEELQKLLLEEDFREENSEEEEEEGEDNGIADECPDEMRCGPVPCRGEVEDSPYEGEDERLMRYSPSDEELRLRSPTP